MNLLKHAVESYKSSNTFVCTGELTAKDKSGGPVKGFPRRVSIWRKNESMWRLEINPEADNSEKNKVTFFRLGSKEFIQVSKQSYMKSNLVMRGLMLSVMTEGFSDVFLSSFSYGWIASTQGKFELEHAVCTNDSEEEIRARCADQCLIAEVGFDKRQQRIHEFSCVFLIDPRKQKSLGSIKRLRDEFSIDLDLPYEERKDNENNPLEVKFSVTSISIDENLEDSLFLPTGNEGFVSKLCNVFLHKFETTD